MLLDSWKAKIKELGAWVHWLLWVFAIYLLSELLIWGASCALLPLSVEFFASSLGMALVFALTTMLRRLWRAADDIYKMYIKPKVDFINCHLGIAFSVPLVMLNQTPSMDSHAIALVIANFVITSIFSWVFVFFFSLAMRQALRQFQFRHRHIWQKSELLPSTLQTAPSISADRPPAQATGDGISFDCPPQCLAETSRFCPHEFVDLEQPSSLTILSSDSSRQSWTNHSVATLWYFLGVTYPLILSFLGIFLLGIPIEMAVKDERVLDACILWFAWISSLRFQQILKVYASSSHKPRSGGVLVTLMNPILMTTLLMTAYTRAKTSALRGMDLKWVLSQFSGGTPLYALWTAAVTGNVIPDNPSLWFGAGDAALSFLEVGIVVWGFKLYECRRQLFSVAGLLTAVASAVAAAANVYFCTWSGRAMGLGAPEALSFAGRSTTLALAKPAVETVGGNVGVNAAIVVSNGMLAQTLCPFVLERLGVYGTRDKAASKPRPSLRGEQCLLPEVELDSRQGDEDQRYYDEDDNDGEDAAITIAAGITVGINGAAMGVAHLYERRSRAAPYAALSMTIFGVSTVVFMTVGPFQEALVVLANR